MRPGERRRGTVVLRVVAVMPFVAAGLALAFSETFRSTMTEGTELLARGELAALRRWAADLGAWAPVATSLLMIVQAIAAPIPAILITITNSLLFGPLWGGVLSIVSANIAAAACYAIGRALGSSVVSTLLGERRMGSADRFARQHGVATVLVARLLPFVPFDPISYVAGVARMRFVPFFVATLVGQTPAGMTYSYLAAELAGSLVGGERPGGLLVLEIVVVLLTLAITGWTVRRWLSRRGHDESGGSSGN